VFQYYSPPPTGGQGGEFKRKKISGICAKAAEEQDFSTAKTLDAEINAKEGKFFRAFILKNAIFKPFKICINFLVILNILEVVKESLYDRASQEGFHELEEAHEKIR